MGLTPRMDTSARESTLSLSVPLLVKSPVESKSDQPVRVGVPFARGALVDPKGLGVFDPSGEAVLSQTRPLASWPDGSVKWLLVDFVASGVPRGRSHWTLRSSEARTEATKRPRLHVSESAQGVTVDTGPATFCLSRTLLQPLAQVRVGGEELLDSSRSGIVLVCPQGRRSVGRVERICFESQGAVRVTVRLEGRFPGPVPCRFVARVSFFAGTGLVRLSFTLHNPNRARHRNGLWDLGDPGSMLFRDLSVELAVQGSKAGRASWQAETDQSPRTATAGTVQIYQDSSGGENWRSRNHVNREGRIPCSFRGYRVRTAEGETFGRRATPVLRVEAGHGAVAASVAEFWQQFPKAIGVEAGVLRIGLFPGEFDDLFELQGGEQKTHTVWFDFGAAGEAEVARLDWAGEPACVHAPVEQYAGAGVFPQLLSEAEAACGDRRLDDFLAEAGHGQGNLLERREIIDEYGWRNYGEVYADHENAYYQGPPPVISHYNNQYDMIDGFALQFLRSGDPVWLEQCDALVRHVVDIDIYRTDRDKPAYNGGLFWHTDHYKDAATCTHRTYSRRNDSAGGEYGGGPASAHNFTTGLLHYYYLAGDEPAREAVVSLADWVLRMDDGRRTWLGLLDEAPTGLATATGGFDYHGPGRAGANSINALLDGWLVAQRREYLDKAEELVRRSIHPGDDLVERHLLDIERRWSYTTFLCVLARYLDLKAEMDELDGPYAYARASLVAYASWMVDHEVPYLDRAEMLEFPTETWAAQELRKANVMWLAARHADEPSRSRLLARAPQVAERAWSDLLGFKSRRVTRAIAIMMIEGLRHRYFEAAPLDAAPRPTENCDFGAAEVFVPQRGRVLAQMKSVRGLGHLVRRLLDVRVWRRWRAARVAGGRTTDLSG